ncbi:MAG: hypothetical protein MJZ82_02295 [Paludibacteraceae bacterium]|nr:hypothetical protein [Paludibacteraceae bacterium]
MRRLFLLSLIALGGCLMAGAQSSSVISFAVRGGADVYLSSPKAVGVPGPEGMFDIQYACYFPTRGHAELGFRTGIGVGATRLSFRDKVAESFSNTDYLGHPMDYQVLSDEVRMSVSQFQVEVPLLFTLRANGFYFDLGLTYRYLIRSRYAQSISDLSIVAYYPEYDVYVRNELITGQLDADRYAVSGRGLMPHHHLFCSFEWGYDWSLSDLSQLGLGLYLNISPWNDYQPKSASSEWLIDVGEIVDPSYPPAEVKSYLLTDVSALQFKAFTFGLRLRYSLTPSPYSSYRRYRYRR